MSNTNDDIQAVVVRGELVDENRRTFPQILLEIISNTEHSEIIGWLPHGKGFMIYQKKRLATEILPRYFKHSKFTSFTRKLNRWGFTRVTNRGRETGAYYHKLFQRDKPRLCQQMRCENSEKPRGNMSAQGVPSTGNCYTSITAEALAARRVLYQHQLMCLRMEEEEAIKKNMMYLKMLQSEHAHMAAEPSKFSDFFPTSISTLPNSQQQMELPGAPVAPVRRRNNARANAA